MLLCCHSSPICFMRPLRLARKVCLCTPPYGRLPHVNALPHVDALPSCTIDPFPHDERRLTWKSEFSVEEPMPKLSMFVLPTSTAPAALSRATAVASYAGT